MFNMLDIFSDNSHNIDRINVKIKFTSDNFSKEQTIILLIDDTKQLHNTVLELDKKCNFIISSFINANTQFKGSIEEIEFLYYVDPTTNMLTKIMLVGIGNQADLNECKLRNIGGILYKNAHQKKVLPGYLILQEENFHHLDHPLSSIYSFICSGIILASYKFDKYRSESSQEDTVAKHNIEEINIYTPHSTKIQKIFDEHYQPVDRGVIYARDLINEIPNVLTPEIYAEKLNDLHYENLKIDILDEMDIKDLGMMALWAVGKGSSNRPKVAIMEYNGVPDKEIDPVCLVGKGVTFDSGGISLKPANNMGQMKYDMAGSATVVGTMIALAARKAKTRVVGIIGIVENMPGGNAQRPGDVVISMSGKTIEIENTDAEGRLVLCDCLWYVQEKFKPSCIIDLATLTGAVTVALGNTYAGLFTHSDDLYNKLNEIGLKTDEKIWRLPLHQDYLDMLKSDIAHISNIGGLRGAAGSSTAAQFLSQFIKKENLDKWVHLDIASVAWVNDNKKATCPKGALGFGVRLLNQLINKYYEE